MARGAWWPAVGSRDQTYISSAAPRLVYLSYSVVVMALVGASQGGGRVLVFVSTRITCQKFTICIFSKTTRTHRTVVVLVCRSLEWTAKYSYDSKKLVRIESG